jgi:hypothetical protein
MQLDRIILRCPYILGNPEGLMCNAAIDFIKNIKDIDLSICLSKHYESCYIYFSKLREEDVIPVSLFNAPVKRE